MAASWIDLLAAAVGGGGLVKAVDIAFSLYTRRSEAKTTARGLVSRHLDPILKAGDELVGKLCSLARTDFKGIEVEDATKRRPTVDVGNILYLFVQLWSRIEILRKEALYVELSADPTGERLKSFFTCLESTGVRVVDRARQRALGEGLVSERKSGSFDCMGFRDFMDSLWTSDSGFASEWIRPLEEVVASAIAGRTSGDSRSRQRILQYGVVVHVLLDTIDPKYQTVTARPSYPNKLSNRTRRDLRFRVFANYLSDVKDVGKYTDPERGRRLPG